MIDDKFFFYSLFMFTLEIINGMATYRIMKNVSHSYRHRYTTSYFCLTLYSIGDGALILLEILIYTTTHPIIWIAIIT